MFIFIKEGATIITVEKLFEPISLKSGVKIKNRLFKGAMSEGMANKKNHVTPQLITLYKRWAQGGIGLSLTGNVMVDSRYLGEPGNIVVENEDDLNALSQWASAGSLNGSHIWMQINHPGKQSPRTISKHPIAPSAVPLSGSMSKAFNSPREMTLSEVQDTIQRFINTALIAKKAGFTGVQIHGAHGYLVNQFLSAHDNRRSDQYGGSLENRMRFLVEIYQGMRKNLGQDYPIGLKINSTDFKTDGFSEADSLAVIKKMDSLGIDLVEISGGNYENPKMMGDGDVYFLDYASKISQLVSVPIAVIGGFRKVESMIEAVSTTDVSMIGVARPLVIEPDLPNQIQTGTYQAASLPRLTTGVGFLDKKVGSLAAMSYYSQQMKRMGEGLAPRVHRNAWSPLLQAAFSHGPAALSPKRS